MPWLLALLLTLLACSAWVHAQARRSGQSRAMALVVAPLGGLALTLTLVWLASSVWSHLRDKTGPLPLALDVAEEVFAAESGGLREGCGVFIHRLTEASRLDLAQRGLAKLQTARTGREQPTHHRYGAWQRASATFHVRGEACIDLPDDVIAMISTARATGFGTEGHEFDLLADPVSGLVVFSFNG